MVICAINIKISSFNKALSLWWVSDEGVEESIEVLEGNQDEALNDRSNYEDNSMELDQTGAEDMVVEETMTEEPEKSLKIEKSNQELKEDEKITDDQKVRQWNDLNNEICPTA